MNFEFYLSKDNEDFHPSELDIIDDYESSFSIGANFTEIYPKMICISAKLEPVYSKIKTSITYERTFYKTLKCDVKKAVEKIRIIFDEFLGPKIFTPQNNILYEIDFTVQKMGSLYVKETEDGFLEPQLKSPQNPSCNLKISKEMPFFAFGALCENKETCKASDIEQMVFCLKDYKKPASKSQDKSKDKPKDGIKLNIIPYSLVDKNLVVDTIIDYKGNLDQIIKRGEVKIRGKNVEYQSFATYNSGDIFIIEFKRSC